ALAAGPALAGTPPPVGQAPAASPGPFPLPLPTPTGKRPNLVLFFPDEMRADALGCYGNPVCKTPNYDRLAAQGTRFAQCHVQFPVCGASRCSLLTGWPTSVHGHRSLYYFLRPDEPNLFRYLKEAGYDVYWFGKNDALAQQSFTDSVTQWYDAPSHLPRPRPGEQRPAPDAPLTMLTRGAVDPRATPDHALLELAIGVLEQRERERPFCIFLPTGTPHPPYRAPTGFDTLYDPARLPALIPPGLPVKPRFHAAMRETYRLDAVDDATLRQVRATYYGQVSYTDWLLGELMDAIDRTGHAADTALIASSDHGDYAGDYGLIEKWPSGLEDCLTHVPLLIRAPGGKAGHVVEEMTELYDVMATMLELAGTRARHTHFAASLVPQLKGAAGDPARAAYSEGGYNTYEPQAFEPRLGGLYAPKTDLQNLHPATVARVASVKTRDAAFIARPEETSELYDRRADPGLTQNRIAKASAAGEVAAHQLDLMNRFIRTTGIPPVDKDPRDTPPFYPMASFR
ncbi:sulfatase-like hydrolase/transferase, partial [Novosphingobium sp. 1949]